MTFGWVWPVVPLIQSDCRIPWSSVYLYLERIKNHQNVWEKNQLLSYFFLHEVKSARVDLRLVFLVRFGQVCLLPNQIKKFIDQQYILKKVTWYLSFLWMELVVKGRQHLRVPISVGCGQVCVLSNQITGFFGEFLKGINWYLRFFAWSYTLNEGSIWNYNCLGQSRCDSSPIGF